MLPYARRLVLAASYPSPEHVHVVLPEASRGRLLEALVRSLLLAYTTEGSRRGSIGFAQRACCEVAADDEAPLACAPDALLRYLSVTAGLHTHHPANALVLDASAHDLLALGDEIDCAAVKAHVRRGLERTTWLHSFEGLTSADALWAAAWTWCCDREGTDASEDGDDLFFEWLHRTRREIAPPPRA